MRDFTVHVAKHTLALLLLFVSADIAYGDGFIERHDPGAGPSDRMSEILEAAQRHLDLGEFGAANALFLEAVALAKTKFGAESREHADALQWLATSYQPLGKHEAAMKCIIQSSEITLKTSGKDSRRYAAATAERGKAFYSEGRLDEAEKWLRKGYEDLRDWHDNKRGDVRDALIDANQQLAQLCLERGRRADAIKLFARVHKDLRDRDGAKNAESSIVDDEAGLLFAEGNFTAAAAKWEQLLDAMKAEAEKQPWEFARLRGRLGTAYLLTVRKHVSDQ